MIVSDQDLVWPRRHQVRAVAFQIKNVPKWTHAILRCRAAAAPQSLQKYLLTRPRGRFGALQAAARASGTTVIVVDASVLVTALGDDGPDGDRGRDRLRGERLTAPELIDIEVVSVPRRLHAAGRLDTSL